MAATDLETLKANYEAARERAKQEKTVEAREAAKAAWAALEAATPRRKASGFASRAGQRQWAETRARYPWHRKS